MAAVKPPLDAAAPSSYQRRTVEGTHRMAEHKATYEFAEVKAQDIMPERQGLWAAFTNATKWAIIVIVGILVMLYLVFG